MFARFGVRVTVVEMADRLLPGDEPEAGEGARGGVRRRRDPGADRREVSLGAHADGTFTVALADQEVTADKLLVAAGRTPNLAGIGLESLGLDADARVLETDERLRAGEKLWAVGDITGKGAFTHVSMYQAAVVGPRHPRRGRSVGRLPRGQPGDLHRRPRSPRSG